MRYNTIKILDILTTSKNEMNATPPTATITCLRCNLPMKFLGKQGFSDDTRWAATAPAGGYQAAVIYVCPQCQKLEFFLLKPEAQQKVKKRPLIPDLPIELSPLAIAPDPINLLKLVPEESTLADVYETVGHPAQSHVVERGVALCYPSEIENVPQTVLINPWNQRVELVTVYNDAELFTLEALEQAYGLRELAETIDGNEHWFFEDEGVAFVVEGRTDSDIMYVQLFKPTMSIEEYQNADGFSSETFIC